MNQTDSNLSKPAATNATPTSDVSKQPVITQPGAQIGSTIKIHGDLSGKEDLIINGIVEGTIDFRENNVSVGEQGRVNANITARNIIVSGELKGELRGSEQVTIKPTGRVTGDIRAPRVVLNDGCQFKGLVDMEDKPVAPGESRNPMGNKPIPQKPAPPTSSGSFLTRKKL